MTKAKVCVRKERCGTISVPYQRAKAPKTTADSTKTEARPTWFASCTLTAPLVVFSRLPDVEVAGRRDETDDLSWLIDVTVVIDEDEEDVDEEEVVDVDDDEDDDEDEDEEEDVFAA